MMTPLLNARVDPQIVAQLDLIATERGLTRSDLVREAIAKLIEDHEKSKESKR